MSTTWDTFPSRGLFARHQAHCLDAFLRLIVLPSTCTGLPSHIFNFSAVLPPDNTWLNSSAAGSRSLSEHPSMKAGMAALNLHALAEWSVNRSCEIHVSKVAENIYACNTSQHCQLEHCFGDVVLYSMPGHWNLFTMCCLVSETCPPHEIVEGWIHNLLPIQQHDECSEIWLAKRRWSTYYIIYLQKPMVANTRGRFSARAPPPKYATVVHGCWTCYRWPNFPVSPCA